MTLLLALLLCITAEPSTKCLVTGYLVPIAERLDTRSPIVLKLLDTQLDGELEVEERVEVHAATVERSLQQAN